MLLLLLAGAAEGAQPPAAEQSAPPAALEDEFGRGSPRGAVQGYLAACREGDYAKAANYLDLRRI